MEKLFKNIRILVVIILLFSGCAFFDNLVKQSEAQIYTFNYDGKDFSALLPNHVPMPPEDANIVIQDFWAIYVLHAQFMEGKEPYSYLPVVSFWFTPDLGVFGLVWHTLGSDGEIRHEAFLYFGGLPVPADIEKFQETLDNLASGKPIEES